MCVLIFSTNFHPKHFFNFICPDVFHILLTYSMEQSPSWEANWSAASQEISRILWTRRFINALTSARHLSLSWASSIQSTHAHPTSRISILILSSHLRLGLPSDLLHSGFPTKDPVHTSPLPHTRYMPRPSYSSWFYPPHNIEWGVQIIQLLVM
jgi:hypothetical protein